MRPMRDGLPNAAVLDPRYSVQLAPCTVCGTTLDTYVTDCTYPVSGVTVLRCPKCRTVETEAMRIQARQAFLKLVAKAEATMHPCARPACVKPVPPSRRYCGRDCAALHQQEQRREKLAAQQVSAEQRAETIDEARRRRHEAARAARYVPRIETATCACGCGETFTYERKNKKRRYVNNAHGQQWRIARKRQEVAA